MRAVVQRVRHASVIVDDDVIGQIGPGLLVLLGVAREDGEKDVDWMAAKLAGLRIFSDNAGKMNRSVSDSGGGVLVVSQFTLLGDVRKGTRPSFTGAADPSEAERLYDLLCVRLREQGLSVATGQFGAHMDVELLNDGPVTILLDSGKTL